MSIVSRHIHEGMCDFIALEILTKQELWQQPFVIN